MLLLRHINTFYRCICLLGGCLLFSVSGMAQEQPRTSAPAKDTTQVIAPADTTLQTFDQRIIHNLRQMSERKTIMGKLLKALLVFDRKPEEVYGLDAELLKQEYEKHTYKIVRRVDIMNLDAFGYSINDTTRVPGNFFEKAGNSLHVKTGRGLIRNKLLFKTSEPLAPQALIESERLLRQTDYLLDARIVVNEVTTTNDSVDVFVLTRDIFSLGGSGSFSPSSGSGRIVLRELNFLGQGHQLRTNYRFGMDAPRPWEFSGSYLVENISNSYLSAEVVYANQNYYQERSFFLKRDFFSTNTKYAGAVGLGRVEERILLPPVANDTLARYGNLSYDRRDVWLARSFKPKSYNLGYEARGRIIVGLRFINTDYREAPTENFHDNVLLLGSVGYSIRKYYKDRFLFGFGRTEDVPVGTFVALTAGYEKGNAYRRYLGATTSFARYTPAFGYLYGGATYGSFVRDGSWEQGVLDVQSLYFTRLYERGNWKLRHYLLGHATFGIRRNPEEMLSINNEYGLRGFNSEFVRGTRRISLNYEANLYTPLSLLGFRLAGVVFADFAWLSTGNQSSPFKEAPYRGYGVGFRLRNEFLSFSTIQFLFSYYPRLPVNEDLSDFRIFNTSRSYYDFTDFRFTRPGVAEFR